MNKSGYYNAMDANVALSQFAALCAECLRAAQSMAEKTEFLDAFEKVEASFDAIDKSVACELPAPTIDHYPVIMPIPGLMAFLGGILRIGVSDVAKWICDRYYNEFGTKFEQMSIIDRNWGMASLISFVSTGNEKAAAAVLDACGSSLSSDQIYRAQVAPYVYLKPTAMAASARPPVFQLSLISTAAARGMTAVVRRLIERPAANAMFPTANAMFSREDCLQSAIVAAVMYGSPAAVGDVVDMLFDQVGFNIARTFPPGTLFTRGDLCRLCAADRVDDVHRLFELHLRCAPASKSSLNRLYTEMLMFALCDREDRAILLSNFDHDAHPNSDQIAIYAYRALESMEDAKFDSNGRLVLVQATARAIEKFIEIADRVNAARELQQFIKPASRRADP